MSRSLKIGYSLNLDTHITEESSFTSQKDLPWKNFFIEENPNYNKIDSLDLSEKLYELKERYNDLYKFKKVCQLSTTIRCLKPFIIYANENNSECRDVVLDSSHFFEWENKDNEIPYFTSLTIINKDFGFTYKRNHISSEGYCFLFFNNEKTIYDLFFKKDAQKYDPGVYELAIERNQYTLNKINLKYIDKPILSEKLWEHLNKDITCFFNNADFYKNNPVQAMPYKRGIIIYGPPGCHSLNTEILMYDGSLKKIQDIKVGDLVMGPDSKSREVLKLVRGKEQMYQIIPNKGDSFEVNQGHILSLAPSHKNDSIKFNINISVKDFINQSKPFKEKFKLYRKEINFEEKNLEIPPYILGLWLGDGNSDRVAITTADNVIKEVWEKYILSNGLKISEYKSKKNSKATTYSAIDCGSGNKNKLNEIFKKLNIINNKHIPLNYLTCSKQQRLELLAGLIDSDGYVNGYCSKSGKGRSLEILQKSEILYKNIEYLSRSLGYSSYTKACKKTCYVGKKKFFTGNYFRTSINGNLNEIPTIINHKKCGKRKQIKDVKRIGFSIKKSSVKDYYGFTLDKDHLYLTSDFIVHHNCGKTSFVKYLLSKYPNTHCLFVDTGMHFSTELFDYIKKVFPEESRKIIVFEDVESINQGERTYSKRSSFLNFIDGAKTSENTMFLATTNYIDLVDEALADRPSRFDKRYHIGLPGKKSRKEFLEKFFPELKHPENKEKLEKLIDKTNNFSGAYFKELFIMVGIQKTTLEEAVDSLSKQIKNFKDKKFDPKQSKGIGLSSGAYPWDYDDEDHY